MLCDCMWIFEAETRNCINSGRAFEVGKSLDNGKEVKKFCIFFFLGVDFLCSIQYSN